MQDKTEVESGHAPASPGRTRRRVIGVTCGVMITALAIAGIARPDLYRVMSPGQGEASAADAPDRQTASSATAVGTATAYSQPVPGVSAAIAEDDSSLDRWLASFRRTGAAVGRRALAAAPTGSVSEQCAALIASGLAAPGRGQCARTLSWSIVALPNAATVLGFDLAAQHLAATAASAQTGTSGSDSSASGTIAAAAVGGIQVAAVAPTIVSGHPRLILDATTLATLRQRAAANTAQWTALKATCDSYIGGSVSYPAGDAYPDKPSLGSGYQGEDYLPALLAEGMCYQVLKSTDATTAAKYGDKAVDILMKMSAPFSTGSGNQGADPCTDSGYGIRFYGVGYGLGYDWVYDLLTSAQRTQIYTTANAWLTAWEASGGCADFEYQHPQSNYYAGYFHAKAVIALATFGDNASAQAQWNDWYGNQFAVRVQPFYAKHLAGGGWPEGFGNYAPLGIQNMSLPAREVKTATGTDLVNATAAYAYPVDSASYLMHFTWPSRSYIDDRDTNRSNGGGSAPGTAQVGMFQQVLGEIAYWNSPLAAAFRQYTSAVATATSNYSPAPSWLAFLEVDPSGSSASFDSQPLSYFASGMGAVSARSDWTSSAAWMSFRAGPYVNNPAQGEEYFDQGSLALVRGGTPLLLNAGGWLVHEPSGSADEDRIYADNYGSFNGSIYNGNRQLYNVFYVRNISGSTVAAAYGQGAKTTEDDGVRTQVSAYEDGSDYVYLRAVHLEDMYRASGGSLGAGVTAWSREVTYVRPHVFVVHDRTTASSTSLDPFMAWHFPASPTAVSSTDGARRFDVTYSGTFAGAMTTVIPANATTTTTALYPSSSPTKAWQVQVRAPAPATTAQWLTVFDLSSTAAGVASASSVTINQGNVVGVRLAATDGVSVVINSAGTPDTPISGSIAYFVPNEAALHVVTELQPYNGYSITVAAQSSGRTVTIAPGGTYNASGKGVLVFSIDAEGKVGAERPVYSTLPISTIPVSDPVPYTPGS